MHVQIVEVVYKHRLQYKDETIEDLQYRIDNLSLDLQKLKQGQSKQRRRSVGSGTECSAQTDDVTAGSSE